LNGTDFNDLELLLTSKPARFQGQRQNYSQSQMIRDRATVTMAD